MKRYEKLSSFRVMDILTEARRYDDTIHFEVGQPDLPPPPGVRRAMIEAVQKNRFQYTESRGIFPLRQKISAHYRSRYALEIDPERIVVTPGTSVAFMVAYLLLLESGERIALPDPSYPCYKNFAHMASAEPMFIPAGREEGYLLKPSMLEGIGAKALHISSPANPTGRIYDAQSLKVLAGYCDEEGIGFVCDELYHGLVYSGQTHSALEYSDSAIVVNGFSKYFCMPGLRLGWMIVPEDLIRPAEIIAQNLYIAAPTPVQYAALEAFDYDYLESVRQTYRERRDYLYGELSQLFGIDALPEGAFYLWCDVSAYTEDSAAMSMDLLREIHVAVTPGADFAIREAKSHLRFAYTTETEHMREGVERLKEYLNKRR